jgi:hypothetical protein
MHKDEPSFETWPTARAHLDKGVYTLEELKEIVEALEYMNRLNRLALQACQLLEKPQ